MSSFEESVVYYLTIDGMFAGTGIRDSVTGGYLKPADLGLSAAVRERLARWLADYERAHHGGYDDLAEVVRLDAEGGEIARAVREELPSSKVEYFSDARMVRVGL